MRKYLSKIAVAAMAALSLPSCEAQKTVVNRQVEAKDGGQMLLGTQTPDQFQKEPFSDWYNKEYQDYQLDEAALAGLKKEKLNSYQLVAFMGTWCEDSHREFPRFMKILETLHYPAEKLSIIAVNRKKESPNGEEGQYNIQRVPTFIVKKYGKEIGRIVEFPKSGFIEKDLLEILKKDNSSVKDLFK